MKCHAIYNYMSFLVLVSSSFYIGKRKRNEILHQHCFICKKTIYSEVARKAMKLTPKIHRVV
jgi:hypothetical protein